MTEVKLVSFDAADTLFRVHWDPAKFPIRMAEKYLGVKLDEQVAREVYLRLCQGSLQTYWDAHQKGEEACLLYWEDLTFQWLDRVSPVPFSRLAVQQLMAGGWQDFFDPQERWFDVFEDVRSTLTGLRARGLKTCILSNWDFTLPRLVKEHDLDDLFDAVFPSLRYGIEKPARELFGIVETTFHLSGKDILHVGDHPIDDFQGATQAGWRALLLDRGNETGSDLTIRSLSELLERV